MYEKEENSRIQLADLDSLEESVTTEYSAWNALSPERSFDMKREGIEPYCSKKKRISGHRGIPQ